MIGRVRKQIEQFHMLEKGDRVLIGLSGGADSVCLTQCLHELQKEFAIELGAVYCHHGIRGEEADEDGYFAQQFCKERGISFYSISEKVSVRAKEKKMTEEEAGRDFRYETFWTIMQKEGYNKLAVAHNADDRAETMLFHLARGTGIAGLSTMEPKRLFADSAWLIRPLIGIRKEDIEFWLCEKKITWRVDRTNLEDVYSRNQIRHYVIPALQTVNEKAVEHMGDTAEHLREICSYLKEEEDILYRECVREEKDRMVLSVPSLEKKHSYMKKSILYRSFAESLGEKKDITSVHVNMLLDLLEGKSGRTVSLIKGVRGQRSYDELILFKPERNEKYDSQQAVMDGLEVVMEKSVYNGQEILKNEYTKQFDYAKITNELCVRFWQQGDYLYLKEDGGKKKLSRYFIDAKIPPEERERIPLLADGSHILWIAGHRMSAYYKVTDKTKEILTVTIRTKE